MTIRVCIAGITGQIGRSVAAGLAAEPDLRVASGVGRTPAESSELPGGQQVPMFTTVAAAIAGSQARRLDVLVDLTEPDAAKVHARVALEAGLHVVIGATAPGSESDPAFLRLGALAAAGGRAIAVVPNLALTMAWLEWFCLRLPGSLGQISILDRAGPGVRAPLNTSVALADVLTRAGRSAPVVASERAEGLTSEVVVSVAGRSEGLTIRHVAHDPAAYAAGAALAVRKVSSVEGFRHGLGWALDG